MTINKKDALKHVATWKLSKPLWETAFRNKFGLRGLYEKREGFFYSRDIDVTEQVIEFIREWTGKHSSIPYDVSAWKNTGVERGYDRYFGIKWEDTN